MIKYFFLILLFSFSLFAQEAAFDSTRELTLQEEQSARTYVHEGKLRNTTVELCNDPENKFSNICTEDRRAFDKGSLRTIEAMLPAVTKAYALITSLGGGKIKTYAKSATGKMIYVDKDGKETLDDGTTVSKIAGEAIAVGLAQGRNEVAKKAFEQSATETKQAAAFYSLAKTHKDLAKASNIQTGVWGASAGCYAIQIASPSVVKDYKLTAKLAGSALIAVFYKKKADAHKERAKLLEEIAKKLPQAGECNPFSNTSCFCNEPTSFTIDPSNYNRFCVPSALALRNQETGQDNATICVNAKGQTDAACDCKTR